MPAEDWEDDAQELLDIVAYDYFDFVYDELNIYQKMYVLRKVGEILDEDSQESHAL